ncbi:MAG TPA: peptidase U62, partial [Edaphobacter sp.]
MKSAVSSILCAGALLSTMAVTNNAIAATPQNDDTLLKAMQAELDREKTQLVLQGMQRPFFIEYRMDDIGTYEAVANYGALIREEAGHQRLLRVTVRVGDYKLDSSTGRGEGTVVLAPS